MNFLSSERLDDRRIGQKRISELKEGKSNTLIIHYSCESFFNLQGRTPRVTSIVVKNRENHTSLSFSIHLMAQIKNRDISNLSNDDFNYLEKEMLKDFYKYQKNHLTYKWVHWNMRNANFGFEAISNRFRILGGHPKQIEDQFKYDLPDTLGLIHTYEFEKHDEPSKGQLLNLCIRNKISINGALKGKEEAKAFENKNFLKIHMSTTRKVEMMDRILTLQEKKKLKTNALLYKSCGITPSGIIEIVRNNWILFVVWSLIMAVVGMALEPVIQNWFGTDNFTG
jgi:hypothetical protein